MCLMPPIGGDAAVFTEYIRQNVWLLHSVCVGVCVFVCIMCSVYICVCVCVSVCSGCMKLDLSPR